MKKKTLANAIELVRWNNHRTVGQESILDTIAWTLLGDILMLHGLNFKLCWCSGIGEWFVYLGLVFVLNKLYWVDIINMTYLLWSLLHVHELILALQIFFFDLNRSLNSLHLVTWQTHMFYFVSKYLYKTNNPC